MRPLHPREHIQLGISLMTALQADDHHDLAAAGEEYSMEECVVALSSLCHILAGIVARTAGTTEAEIYRRVALIFAAKD